MYKAKNKNGGNINEKVLRAGEVVTPWKLPVRRLLFVSALKSVVLPALGLPASTTFIFAVLCFAEDFKDDFKRAPSFILQTPLFFLQALCARLRALPRRILKHCF